MYPVVRVNDLIDQPEGLEASVIGWVTTNTLWTKGKFLMGCQIRSTMLSTYSKNYI